jgi:hypothetical protein
MENHMSGPAFSGPVYDKLKPVAQIWLPAFITLYTTIAIIWNLAFQTEVVGTLGAINVFLGIVLGISSSNFKASGQDPIAPVVGAVQSFEARDGRRRITLKMDMPAEELLSKKFVTLAVEDKPIKEGDPLPGEDPSLA